MTRLESSPDFGHPQQSRIRPISLRLQSSDMPLVSACGGSPPLPSDVDHPQTLALNHCCWKTGSELAKGLHLLEGENRTRIPRRCRERQDQPRNRPRDKLRSHKPVLLPATDLADFPEESSAVH